VLSVAPIGITPAQLPGEFTSPPSLPWRRHDDARFTAFVTASGRARSTFLAAKAQVDDDESACPPAWKSGRRVERARDGGVAALQEP